MKKTPNILLILIGMIGVLLVPMTVMASYFGNPLSEYLGKRSTIDYINSNYSEYDMKYGYSYFDRDQGYCNYVYSDKSEDVYFYVYTNTFGSIKGDSSEDVWSGYNTWSRLNDKYSEKTYELLSTREFGVAFDAGVGDLMKIDEYNDYGIDMTKLEVDKEYDINELGAKYGRINVYFFGEPTVENTAEVLMNIRNVFDEEGVKFYSIDINIREDEKSWGEAIDIVDLRYEDINKDGLKEKIEEKIR